MKNNENKLICAECGGKCCKNMPGSVYPKDVPNGDIEALLRAGNYAIDWWEGDPRKECGQIGKASYYIRPKVKGVKRLFDPSWGGECIFLTSTGCKLSFEERPAGCKIVKPAKGGCNSKYNDKRGAAIAWSSRSDELQKIGCKILENS